MEKLIKPFGLVYLVTNLANKKVYVGQTKQTLMARWRVHLKHARYGRDGYVQRAIRKYGSENFKIEVLQYVSSLEEMNRVEKEFILKYSSLDPGIGYNLVLNHNGRKQEFNEKISKSSSGPLNHSYNHDLSDSELIELYKSGLSLQEVGDRLGVSATAIHKRLRAAKIEVRNKNWIVDAPEKEICEDYKVGLFLFDLRKKYKLGLSVLRKILVKNGIDVSNKYGHPSGEDSKLFKKDIDTKELVLLYQSGMSLINISKIYGVHFTTVKRRIEKEGVQIRTLREAQLIRYVQQPISISGCPTQPPIKKDSPLGCEDVRRPRDPEIAVARVRD